MPHNIVYGKIQEKNLILLILCHMIKKMRACILHILPHFCTIGVPLAPSGASASTIMLQVSAAVDIPHRDVMLVYKTNIQSAHFFPHGKNNSNQEELDLINIERKNISPRRI